MCVKSTKNAADVESQEHGTERENDGLILDCCQYFNQVRQCRTLLCSKDKLLAVEAESAGKQRVIAKTLTKLG